MEKEKITGQIKITPEEAEKIKEKIKNIEQLKKEIENLLTAPISNLLGFILSGIIILKASDLHIEPEEKQARLRIRLDGLLYDLINFDLKLYQALLSRIKLLANLKLNVSDRSQDGRFTVLLGKTIIEIRVSTLPAEKGETVVMRTLNPENLIDIEALGLRKDLEDIFNREIKRPNGMIIVTGPTGSGKTTTLYAVLKKINNPNIKIITIEDPIEYRLEGLSQTQVDSKKNYTFALGLKSIMRQDPDVILVGEIRDLETAEISCQASLTGHLVFSTLHTNDAAGAIARLIDLGIRPISIAPAVNMIIAQRLPRKVCPDCVEFVTPTAEEKEKLSQSLAKVKKEIIPSNFFKKDFKIPRTQGCPQCNNTGYRGRVGIYEIFIVDDEIERFILTSPSITDMRELAIKKGMVLMHEDGLIKVIQGITTIEEIERITGE